MQTIIIMDKISRLCQITQWYTYQVWTHIKSLQKLTSFRFGNLIKTIFKMK